jgi:hypothetical protein
MYLIVRTRSEAQTAAVSAVLVDRLGEGTGTAVGTLGENRWLAPRAVNSRYAGTARTPA